MDLNADDSNNTPFPHQLLAALASTPAWSEAAALTVGAWVRLGKASAAVLISPLGADELELVCCRTSSNGVPTMTRTSVEAPFATLLDQGTLVEIVGESGLVGGLHLEVLPWTDLAASLVLQIPDEIRSEQAEFHQTLTAISRQLLGRCTDRPVLVPDPATMEAVAEFAAGAGHEINNPLASIVGQTQLLLKNEQSPDRRQSFETIGAQAWRIRDMIGNSMLFARPPLPQTSELNLVELAQQTLLPLTATAVELGIEIRLASTSDVIHLTADQTQIITLIAQLVRNSMEALRSIEREGVISVTLHDDQPGTVEICISDNGPGITDDATRRNMFNPFFSGRSAGRGLGFGLCLAWQITRMHHGMILHLTPPEGGAAFHVALPAHSVS